MTRILIAGGGTGGHLFPGLAVAQALKKRGAEILFVGTRIGVEAKIVPKYNYPLDYINVAGFKRGRLLSNLGFPVKVVQALLQSLGIIRRFRPQAALGTGGYVSGPILFIAALCGVPIILQEQNSYPGVTTRLLSRFARKVFLNFGEASRFLPKNAHWQQAGNPVRPGFAVGERSAVVAQWGLNPDLPTLLIFGGSQGAMSLNRATSQVLSELGKSCNLIWGRGERDTSDLSSWTGPGVLAARPFIDDMPSAYAAADLAVCRSGAMTLAELQAAALPAILAPFPHAAGNHQLHNALSYVKSGGAIVIEDKDLSGDKLLATIRILLADRQRLTQMRQALADLPKQDTAELIAAELLSTVSMGEP